MEFKLFLPLASTLVVGGTFTVFYMGYLKNKEIRDKKPNIKLNLKALLPQEDEKPKEGSKTPESEPRPGQEGEEATTKSSKEESKAAVTKAPTTITVSESSPTNLPS